MTLTRGVRWVLASFLTFWPLALSAQPFTMPPPAGIGVTAPYGKAQGSQAKVTIATTNTFQQALASNTLRLGCTIQYVGSNTGYVYFGATPADTTTSFQLSKGQSIQCATATGGVLTSAIQVTATASDVFVVSEQ